MIQCDNAADDGAALHNRTIRVGEVLVNRVLGLSSGFTPDDALQQQQQQQQRGGEEDDEEPHRTQYTKGKDKCAPHVHGLPPPVVTREALSDK